MKQKITYVAFDGEEFATAAECLAHENDNKKHRIKVRGAMVHGEPITMETGTLTEYREFVENAIGMYFPDANQFYRLDTLVGFPHENNNIRDYSGDWCWDKENQEFVKLDEYAAKLEQEIYFYSNQAELIYSIREELAERQ